MLKRMIQLISFTAAAALALLVVLSFYVSALLPDHFFLPEGETFRIGGMPFLMQSRVSGEQAVTSAQKGSSYNTDLAIMGVIPVKTVRAQVVTRRTLLACGTPFGIKMFANGAMVVGFSDIYSTTGYQNPAKTAGLKMGDIIRSIGGVPTKTNEDVAAAIQDFAGAPVEVVFVRNNIEKHVLMTAVLDESLNSWRTGMWVRDSSAGIGTMTFIEPNTKVFAGLGHSIHDVDTGTTIALRKGEIVQVEITDIVAGAEGNPGELKGRFLSTEASGNITVNGETGVYGKAMMQFDAEEMELGFAQEVQAGPAEIISTIDGQTPKHYAVTIEKIALNANNVNRNMVLHITDPELLAKTGGIVQGMSGSPIVQNGRLIGAVTHVLVNDPTRGYAIFAENMLRTADLAAAQKAA